MDLGVAQFVNKPTGLDQFLEIGKLIKDLLAGGQNWTTFTPPRLCDQQPE
jgi:hypothetical protein